MARTTRTTRTTRARKLTAREQSFVAGHGVDGWNDGISGRPGRIIPYYPVDNAVEPAMAAYKTAYVNAFNSVKHLHIK